MRISCESCHETYKDENIMECPYCKGDYCWRCYSSHVDRHRERASRASNDMAGDGQASSSKENMQGGESPGSGLLIKWWRKLWKP